MSEAQRLWAKFDKDRSNANRNALAEHYDRLARGQLKRLPPDCREQSDDMLSELRITLLEAVCSYDSHRRPPISFEAHANYRLRHRRLQLIRSDRERRRNLRSADLEADYESRLKSPPEPPKRTQHLLDELEAATRHLDFTQRTIIYLVYWQGLPLTEVALVLGVSSNTIRKRLRAASVTPEFGELCLEALATAPRASIRIDKIGG